MIYYIKELKEELYMFKRENRTWKELIELDWFSYYVEDRWAFRSTPKISEMDKK